MIYVGMASFSLGIWTLSAALFWNRLTPFAIASVALGVCWLLLHRRKDSLLRTACLVAACVLCALTLFAGIHPLLAAVALSAAIYGWDFSFTADKIEQFPAAARRRFAQRYVAIGSFLNCCGIGLVAIAVSGRTVFGFGPAFGLAFAAFLLSFFLVRSARSSLGESEADKEDLHT